MLCLIVTYPLSFRRRSIWERLFGLLSVF